MTRIALLLTMLAIALPVRAEAPGAVPAGVAQLHWLAGHWKSEQDGRWTEESWTAPRAGTLFGINRSGRDDATRAFEFLRIVAGDDGRPSYIAQPGGGAPTAFVLASMSDGHVVFENAAHDYPTRIEYRRDGDRLIATVSGPGGADPRRWVFVRAH